MTERGVEDGGRPGRYASVLITTCEWAVGVIFMPVWFILSPVQATCQSTWQCSGMAMAWQYDFSAPEGWKVLRILGDFLSLVRKYSGLSELFSSQCRTPHLHLELTAQKATSDCFIKSGVQASGKPFTLGIIRLVTQTCAGLLKWTTILLNQRNVFSSFTPFWEKY